MVAISGGLILTLVIVMAVLLEPIYSMWALLIMPLLGAATFALPHRLIAFTDNNPHEI